MAGQSLDELEGVVWGEPTYHSNLVTTCHRLRAKPLDQFSVEDLRITIGQKIGLPHLMPLAIAVLEREPLAEGRYYPGDLLTSVAGADEWLRAHPEWLERVARVAERVLAGPEVPDNPLRARLSKLITYRVDQPGGPC